MISIVFRQKLITGDNAVRLLLEKMTQCANNVYHSMLETYLLPFPPSILSLIMNLLC